MSLKINKLDPASFLTAPRSPWQAAFKEAKVNLDLFMNGRKRCQKMNMLRYSSKESSCLKYWDVNNLCARTMSQNLPETTLNGLKTFLN